MADDQSIFEANRKGGSTTTIISGSSTDPLSSLMSQKLGQASSMANSGGNFFATDPLNQYPVFLGQRVGPIGVLPKSMLATGQGAAGQPGWSDYQSAILAPTQWDQKQLSEFVNKGILNKIPGFDVGMGLPQIQGAWAEMVKASIMYNQNLKPGQKPWSPDDVMDTWSNQKGKYGTQRKGDWVYDVATGERIEYVGPKTKTVTSEDFDFTSAEDAQVIITQALQKALGRNPTANELAQFKSTISGYEAEHPKVTTTTQTLTPNLETGEVTASDQSSTTTGGASVEALAGLVSTPVQQTKEYGKYQSANYFNMLMQMIGGG